MRVRLSVNHLAHSLWMFLLQLLLTFQDVVSVADSPGIISNDLGLGLTWWADWPHSSEWLAGVKATRKWVNGTLEFTPGCTYNGFFGERDKWCSVWSRLLVGQLRLREDPEFTVRRLEICLFALSGSVFLLVIR